MIRQCTPDDFDAMYEIINRAAVAYRGVIPGDRWKEPYMPREEMLHEIGEGVVFYGLEEGGRLVAVMGIQDRGDVTLIRHAYTLPGMQRTGAGTMLLRHLLSLTHGPVLIGTWADARWAVHFYEKNGFTLVTEEEKNSLLKTYWSIPERQIETSVVMANNRYEHRGSG
jgi:GNAT superfamily N-acetyltransferase